MKQISLLFTAILLGLSYNLSAQEFTIRVSGGYAGPALINTEPLLGPKVDPASPNVDALIPMANINDTARTYKATPGSYGAGGNATIGIGYMFNNYVGVDLGVTYSHSRTYSCEQVRQVLPGSFLNAKTETYSYALAVSPSIVVTGAKTGWKVYPYARLGLVLPVMGVVTHQLHVVTPQNLNISPFYLGKETDVTLKTDGAPSVGLAGSIGVAYRPLPFMAVFVELDGIYLNVRAKSSKVTKWIADGVDDIPARGAYRTQFTYVSQLGPTTNNAQNNPSYDPNKPKEDIMQTAPGSNIGFNVGFTFFLSKKILGKDKVAKKKLKK